MTNGPQIDPWLWLHGFILATTPDRNSHIQNQRRTSSPVGIREKFLRLDRRRHILPTCNNAPRRLRLRTRNRYYRKAKLQLRSRSQRRQIRPWRQIPRRLRQRKPVGRRSSTAAHGKLAAARWNDLFWNDLFYVTSCPGNAEMGIACLIEDLRTWYQQSC